MGYHPKDLQTRNGVAAQLFEAKLVTLSEAVAGFGIPRSTLRDTRQRFQEQGVRGLIPAKSGPKEAWKLVTRARQKGGFAAVADKLGSGCAEVKLAGA